MSKEITINDIKNEEVRNALWSLTNQDITYQDLQECFDILLEACIKTDKYDELMTPKQVIFKPNKTGQMTIRCPKCDSVLHIFYSEVDTVRVYKHCDDCGQRLKY